MRGNPFSGKSVFILLALFLVSVLVRIPTLNRPLSKHHEFCTAIALRVLQVWDEGGIAKYGFNPAMNYENAADKFINNFASGSGKMMDEQGNYYYVSHPPFAYYLPYLVFKILNIKPDVLPIEIFNLVIHLLCAFGVYLILMNLLPKEAEEKISIAALAGYSAYLFSPGPLWFHSNIYMSDMLVQLFFIYGVFFALKLFTDTTLKWLILFGFTLFLMVYTSWLGVFFGAVAFVTMLIKTQGSRLGVNIAITTVISIAAALLLTAFQYSEIAGWEILYEEWFCRFNFRTGLDSIAQSPVNLLGAAVTIFFNYLTSYLPLLAVILLLFLYYRSKVTELLRLPMIKFFLLIALGPIVLLHIFLSNYSGHDFTTLYAGLAFSVLLGVFLFVPLSLNKYGMAYSNLLTVLVFGVLQYYFINRPGEISQSGEKYSFNKEIGESIKELVSDDEVVFIRKRDPKVQILPEVIFYSGRNIKQFVAEADVEDFLEQTGSSKGVIIGFAGDGTAKVEKRIQLD